MKRLINAISHMNQEMEKYLGYIITLEDIKQAGVSILHKAFFELEEWGFADHAGDIRRAKARARYALKNGNHEKHRAEMDIVYTIQYKIACHMVALCAVDSVIHLLRDEEVTRPLIESMIEEEKEASARTIAVPMDAFKLAFEDQKAGEATTKTSAIIQEHVGYILRDCDYINLTSPNFITEINEALAVSLGEEGYWALVGSMADDIVTESLFHPGRTIEYKEAEAYVVKNRLHVDATKAVRDIKDRLATELRVGLTAEDYRAIMEDHACLIENKAGAVVYAYIGQTLGAYHPEEIDSAIAERLNGLLSGAINRADHAVLMGNL